MFRIYCCKTYIAVALLTGAFVVQGAHPAQAESAKTSIQPLVVPGSDTVIPGTGSILVRTKEGVGMTLHSFGLVPGNVYTAWFGIFNNPKACATTPCTPADLMNPHVRGVVLNATGRIAGEDGTADFGAFRAVGDPTGREESLGTAMALEKPLKAEIHLVVRSHGPVLDDPDLLQAQLSMFNGGCPPNNCINVQAAPHLP
jgi:hypothetical protein